MTREAFSSGGMVKLWATKPRKIGVGRIGRNHRFTYESVKFIHLFILAKPKVKVNSIFRLLYH